MVRAAQVLTLSVIEHSHHLIAEHSRAVVKVVPVCRRKKKKEGGAEERKREEGEGANGR